MINFLEICVIMDSTVLSVVVFGSDYKTQKLAVLAV
jgi:hypothetical protein